ncbi:MAG: hypothetical protein IJI24_05975 [Lachnospiraceae bacterium]|nr:hypothetical protein [Lachnospiraceae bacterium]
MERRNNTDGNRRKDLIAYGCLLLACAGFFLGLIFREPIADSFGIGTILSLAAFLLSMASVKDRGGNLPAILAFSLSFLVMCMTIIFSRF